MYYIKILSRVFMMSYVILKLHTCDFYLVIEMIISSNFSTRYSSIFRKIWR